MTLPDPENSPKLSIIWEKNTNLTTSCFYWENYSKLSKGPVIIQLNVHTVFIQCNFKYKGEKYPSEHSAKFS